MNINRTCTIELSRDEVAEALTEYINSKYIPDLKSWHEALLWTATSATSPGLVVTWGEKPEPAPAPAPEEPAVQPFKNTPLMPDNEDDVPF